MSYYVSVNLPLFPLWECPGGAPTPWQVAETKEQAKHLPKENNRRTVLDPFAVAAIRLLILTGARLREILHAKWEHVDFERGILFLPDSKTGKKPIYLSAAVLAVLASLPRLM
jgi:integrase